MTERSEDSVGRRGVPNASENRREQEWRAVSARNEALLEAIPDIIAEVDQEKIYTWMNQAGLEFFGDSAIGRPAVDFFVGPQDIYQLVQPVFDGKESVVYVESWQRRSDDEVRLLAWWCRVLKDADGNVTGALSTARDITHQHQAETALRHSERQYRSLLENLPVGAFRSTAEGHVISANSALARMYGYADEAEFLEKPAGETFLDPTRRDEVVELLKAEGVVSNFESQRVRKDGSVIWVSINAHAVYDSDGEIMFLDGTEQDVTDRRRTDEQLRQRLEVLTRPLTAIDNLAFDDLFDLDEIQDLQDAFARASGVASLITDPDGRPITRPSNFCRLCNDIIRPTKKGLQNCMRSDAIIGNCDASGPSVQACLSGGLWDGGASIRVGERHVANWLVGQVRNEDQDEAKMLAYARDIGANEEDFRQALSEVPTMSMERFQAVCDSLYLMANQLSNLAFQNLQQARGIHAKAIAERALQASEERYRSLVELSPVPIFIHRNGLFTFANPAAVRLHGARREQDLIGSSPRDFVDPADLEEFQRCLAGCSGAVGIAHSVELRIKGLTGETLDVAMTAINMAYADESAELIIYNDLTQQKRQECETVRAQKLDSLGVLAGGIAHDFNNLLTGIMGNISLVRLDAEPGGELSERLEEAENATLRAKYLTQQLLTFSKGGDPVKTIADIGDVVGEAARFATRGSNVKPVFDFSPDLKSVNIDVGQISQVIHNLVLNARQAMPTGGLIHISIDGATIFDEHHLPVENGEYVRIEVRDTGMGIGVDHLKLIFDPYFTTKQHGSGLGLATSHSIVIKHGGYIEVESAIGQGTAFVIYLPATGEAPKAAVMVADTPRLGQGRVLVMDDEDIIRDLSKRILGKFGYSVETAIDGDQAVSMYRRAMSEGRAFDVVILDLTVPGSMGGEEAMRQLRLIDPEVKAIVCSGYSNDPVMSNHRHYHFRGVVSKPFRPSELGEAVRDLVEAQVVS